MTPTPRSRTAFAALATACCLSLAGCGSSDTPSTDPSSPSAATSAGADSPDGGVTAVDTATTGDGGTASSATAACDAVPALDVINAQLDEPVTGVRQLPRGPGEELCEASGDGMANVQFTRLTPSDRTQLEKTAATLGYPVIELNDPALPGALTYAGAVTVFVGDVEYTVQTITMDTISDPTAPLSTRRSAGLLAAWLLGLGVTP